MIYYVYELYNQGRLLYIGCTTRPRRRLYEHRCRKRAQGVALEMRIVVSSGNKRKATQIERTTIIARRPPWQVTMLHGYPVVRLRNGRVIQIA